MWLAAVVAAGWTGGGPHGFEWVTVADRWVVRLLAFAAPGSALALVFGRLLRPRAFPNILLSIGSLAATLLVAPWVCFGSYVPWIVADEIDGPDGRRYALLDHSFLQGQTTVLAQRRSASFASRTFEVLVVGHTDSPREFASVVRPEGGPLRNVYVSPDGVVVGLWGTSAYVAAEVHGGSTWAGMTIGELSPFLLLGTDDRGRDADLAAIAADVASGCAFRMEHPDWPMDHAEGVPTEASLLDALGHANPWVRAAARRIIEAGGAEMYPEATKRIADAPK